MWSNLFSELLFGLGKLFLNPFTYIFFIASILCGYLRVKRERKHFSVRNYNVTFEWKTSIWSGLLIGAIFSVITLVAGISIPIEMVYLVSVFTIVFALILQFRWMSPAYLFGLALVALPLINRGKDSLPLLDHFVPNDMSAMLPAITILLAVLLLAEGILVQRNAANHTTPLFIESKRGKRVGAHEANKLWMVPLFLLIPNGPIISDYSWWPTITLGHSGYSILFVPFGIGFYQLVQGMLPKESVKLVGKQIVSLAILVSIGAIISYFVGFVAFITVAIAVVGREAINYIHKNRDFNTPSYFTTKAVGLTVLGILPNSVADKMNIKVGESITKVNGQNVSTVNEFYEALQINRAYCKLEVIDLNAEIRIAQSSVYEGEHHELGFLFPEEESKYSGQVG
ncbi:PDZ domain-containing protein [Gottfriedia luciferensis]|uniref:PDZ domain-containing protein n=1 Tax=Gottfriedia luciferensis TaxID=178774 RepID=UPI000B441C47|nr:PDZ domain-containing protein [Gottfriedia luciferensis]